MKPELTLKNEVKLAFINLHDVSNRKPSSIFTNTATWNASSLVTHHLLSNFRLPFHSLKRFIALWETIHHSISQIIIIITMQLEGFAH